MLPKPGKHTQNPPPQPLIFLGVHFPQTSARFFVKGAAAIDRLRAPQMSVVNEQQQNISLFGKWGCFPPQLQRNTVKIGMSKLLSWSEEQGPDLRSEED